MSRLTILAFLLFSVLTVSSALDERLPICSAEQYAGIPDVADRLRALEAQLAAPQTEEDFLLMLEDMLILREDFWSEADICEPNLEVGVLISRVLADVAAVNAIESLGIPQDDNPRWLALQKMDANESGYVLKFILELIASGFGPDDAGAPASQPEDFPSACSETQHQRLVGVSVIDTLEILRAALAVDTVADLLQYDGDQLAFRDRIFADLPRCAEAFEIALQISHLTNDFISAHALAFSGLPAASNPYLQRVQAQFNNLPDWLVPTSSGEPANLSDSFATNLPACSAAQLSSLVSVQHPLFNSDGALSQRALGIDSEDELVELAEQEISWRQENLPGFPACAESIAIALSLSQRASDFVAAKSLAFDGVDDSDNPYQSLLSQNAGLVEANLRKARAKSDAGTAEARETALADCSPTQVAMSGQYIFAPFFEVIAPLPTDGRSVRGFDYANNMYAWRESFLPIIPPCEDGLKLALRSSQAIGSITTGTTLATTDVSRDRNPYGDDTTSRTQELVDLWVEMQEALEFLPD